MKGNKTQTNQYLQVNNTTLTSYEDKEAAHRTIWREVFMISPQENALFDRNKEEEVEKYLRANDAYTTTYERSDLNRLRGINQIDSLVTQVEIKKHYKKLQNQHPRKNQCK